MKINRTFLGQRLKEARKKKGLTQQQLGELLGVSFSTVNRWEKGHHEPTLLAKERLKNLFQENGINIEEIKK